MKNPIIICISAKAQHGKDTFADIAKKILEKDNKKVLIIKYGDILKYICKQYFNWDGNKDEKGRSLLQYIGTNVMRKNNDNVWVNCIKEIVKGLSSEFDYILIPDTRFKNEIEEWKKSQFKVFSIRLNRKNEDSTDFDNKLTIEQKEHISETDLDNYNFDYKILNKNIKDIEQQAQVILKLINIKQG